MGGCAARRRNLSGRAVVGDHAYEWSSEATEQLWTGFSEVSPQEHSGPIQRIGWVPEVYRKKIKELGGRLICLLFEP